jgi:hypothetical protein
MRVSGTTVAIAVGERLGGAAVDRMSVTVRPGMGTPVGGWEELLATVTEKASGCGTVPVSRSSLWRNFTSVPPTVARTRVGATVFGVRMDALDDRPMALHGARPRNHPGLVKPSSRPVKVCDLAACSLANA